MPLDYPDHPVTGDIFNGAGVSWRWDGTKWTSVLSAGGPFLPLAGGSMTGPLNIIATGSTIPRSIQDRWADVVNAKDFGVKGDGTTDDTTALQAAINANPGRPLRIPFTGANHIISNSLALVNNSHLIIDGTLFLKAASNKTLFHSLGVNNCTIEGRGVIDGNSANQNPTGGQQSGGIEFINSSNILIRDLTIQHVYNWPVNIATCNDAILDNLNLDDAGSSPEFAAQSYNCWALSGALIGQGVNAAVILGATSGAVAGTPYLEFHSSGHGGADSQLMSSGGTGAADGTLSVNAARFVAPATLTVGGGSGPTWTTGSTVPAATQPVGSIYSRVGGAVGATLYVSRGGGTWAAVAGV